MEQEPISSTIDQAACSEAFPAIAEPPWRGRRTHWAWLMLPLLLVVLISGGLALIYYFQLVGGEDEERELSSGAGLVASHHAGAWGESNEGGPTLFSNVEGDGGVPPSKERGADGGNPHVEGVRAENGLVEYVGRIGEGNTISQRLSSYGLSRRQINEVVGALDGLYDFRGCRPNHQYSIEVSESSKEVQRFRYEVGRTEIYAVERRGGRLKGSRVKVNVTYHQRKVGRRVKGSLSKSLEKAGLKNQVLRSFMQTLGRDINFRRKQQEGDSFRVIVEEERLDGEFIRYREVSALEYSGKALGRLRAFYFNPAKGRRGRFYDEKGKSFDRTRLRTPLNYRRISSPFNLKRLHPVLKRRMPHRGVDFAASRGTPVWATADGQVRFVGRKGASGNLVVIRHAGNLESVYAHLQKFARRLKRGQDVRQGQVIGYVGSTGRSTGPHLHFGLKKNGRFVDPMKIKTGPGVPIDSEYRGAFFKIVRKARRELNAIRIR